MRELGNVCFLNQESELGSSASALALGALHFSGDVSGQALIAHSLDLLHGRNSDLYHLNSQQNFLRFVFCHPDGSVSKSRRPVSFKYPCFAGLMLAKAGRLEQPIHVNPVDTRAAGNGTHVAALLGKELF